MTNKNTDQPTTFYCNKNPEGIRQIIKTITDGSCDLLDNCYYSAEMDLRNVITLVNGRFVRKIDMLCQNCLETTPCQGHGGVRIFYENNSTDEYTCESVGIGAIMTYYKYVYGVTIDSHCCNLINDTTRDRLFETFNASRDIFAIMKNWF